MQFRSSGDPTTNVGKKAVNTHIYRASGYGPVVKISFNWSLLVDWWSIDGQLKWLMGSIKSLVWFPPLDLPIVELRR